MTASRVRSTSDSGGSSAVAAPAIPHPSIITWADARNVWKPSECGGCVNGTSMAAPAGSGVTHCDARPWRSAKSSAAFITAAAPWCVVAQPRKRGESV